MSERRVARALQRLAAPGAVLARERDGVFGVFVGGDRRRRPLVRLSAGSVRELEAAGALERVDEGFILSRAGQARVARDEAAPTEAYLAQHGAVVARAVIGARGDVREIRGLDPYPVLRRLAALKDNDGASWLSGAELAAASRLRMDWEKAEIGLVRGSDWSAAPLGANARGPGNAQEAAMAACCDARRRVEVSLAQLAPPLRRAVERVCLHEQGLEALERAEGWPARSGKLALKFGLAQLAATGGDHARASA